MILWFLGSQTEGRRITIEVLSSKEVASVTVDGAKVGLLMAQSVFFAYLSNKQIQGIKHRRPWLALCSEQSCSTNL